MIAEVVAVVIAYLIGTIPSGKVISRFFGVDIEKVGSGNVGATNVARSVGKIPGFLTLLLDISKGLVGTTIAFLVEIYGGPSRSHSWLGTPISFSETCALFTILGHCIAIPGLLRGGKGVATSLGVLLALSPLMAVLIVATFTVIVALSQMVSLASILAAVSLPLWVSLVPHPPFSLYIATSIAAIVIVRHQSNIKRLCQGKEPLFTLKKKEESFKG